MAGCGGTGAAARFVFGRSSVAAGLYGAEETPGGGAEVREKKKLASPAFVELIATHPAAVAECVIEFESRGGGKMRIQWKASTAPDWASLLRAWREAER